MGTWRKKTCFQRWIWGQSNILEQTARWNMAVRSTVMKSNIAREQTSSRHMSVEEKQPFLDMAETLKRQHHIDHPDYKFKPKQRSANGSKTSTTKKAPSFTRSSTRHHYPPSIDCFIHSSPTTTVIHYSIATSLYIIFIVDFLFLSLLTLTSLQCHASSRTIKCVSHVPGDRSSNGERKRLVLSIDWSTSIRDHRAYSSNSNISPLITPSCTNTNYQQTRRHRFAATNTTTHDAAAALPGVGHGGINTHHGGLFCQ